MTETQKNWIPTFVGMTAERLLLLPINAAISNPVIPAKAGIQTFNAKAIYRE